MKQLSKIIISLFACAIPLAGFAQSDKIKEIPFTPHWYIQLQGGAGHTLGEADFNKLISPAAALSVGRKFTPIWGLRMGISGWEGKGAWYKPNEVYTFNFAQINADVMVDLANLIYGYKQGRIMSPYVFLGVGGNMAFNNDQAQAIDESGRELSLLWTGSKAFLAGRGGVGINFQVSDIIGIGLEVNTNMLPDKFNSKKAGNVDWQMNALLGVSVRLGKGSKKSTVADIAPLVAPQQSVEEPKVEEPKVEAPVVVAEQPAPEAKVIPTPAPVVEKPAPAVRKNAPAPPSPDTYLLRRDIFFTISTSNIPSSENEKIDALVKCLKENPKARVSIVGYADGNTGNSQGNYWLSGWRAIRVRDALKKQGINGKRITIDFKGDKEQPYSDVEENRTAICIIR